MMYYIFPTNKDLQHHGVDGQKWGQRNGPPYPLNRAKNKIGKLVTRLKRNAGNRNSKTLKRARTKDLNKMSDKELERTTKRLKNERDFAKLTQGSIGEGKDFVDNMGKYILSGIIAGTAIEAGKHLLKMKLAGKPIVIWPM